MLSLVIILTRDKISKTLTTSYKTFNDTMILTFNILWKIIVYLISSTIIVCRNQWHQSLDLVSPTHNVSIFIIIVHACSQFGLWQTSKRFFTDSDFELWGNMCLSLYDLALLASNLCPKIIYKIPLDFIHWLPLCGKSLSG